MSKIRSVLTLLFAAAFLLAACGSKKTPPASAPTADDGLAAPVFPVGSSLEAIQKSGKLRVGVAYNQPGFGVKSSGDVEPSGFDIEIAKLLAQGIFGGVANDASQHIDYVETVSTNRETFLQTKRVDVVLAAYPITAARKVQVDFAGPYYVSHGDVMVKKAASNLQRISDLNGSSVCTRAGSLLTTSLQSKAPQVNVDPADSYAQCVQRLKDGTAQGVMSDEVVLAGLVQSSNGAYRTLGSNFSDDPYGIGVLKGDDALRAFINDRLQAIETNGDWAKAYEATLGQLGLETPKPPVIDRYTSASTTSSVPGGSTTTTAPSASTSTSSTISVPPNGPAFTTTQKPR